MEESNYWTRWERKRISRKALLAGSATAALGGAAALMVGCGGGSDNGPSSGTATAIRSQGAAGSPRAGGEIVQGFLINILGIDPHVDLTGLFIVPLLYTYLYSWRPFAEEAIFNDFATSLEIPDPDHLTFIYKLRPGIKVYSNPGNPAAGDELYSEDVKQSFNRRGTSITAPDKRFAFRLAGSREATALLPALQTPDRYTFTYTMKEPFVPAVREVSNPTWAIMPAKVIEKYSTFQLGGLSQKAFGSGAFMLEEFNGYERIVMKRHPEYFLSPRPWLDKYNIVIITDPSSLLAAFDSGQHDIGGALLNKKQADDRKADGSKIIVSNPTRFYPCVHFKMHRPPWEDIRVRKAFDLAMDRDQQIEVIWDGEGNYNGPVQWLMQRFALPQEELRTFQRHDVEEAKALLREAGYEGGITAHLKIPKVPGAPFIVDLASLIKDQVSKVGFNMIIDEVELGTYIANVSLPSNFDVAFFPNLPYDEPDRPLSFYWTQGVTGTGNWNNYTNPDFDALYDAQSRDFDDAHRVQTILEAQRLVLKDYGPQLTLPSGNFNLGRQSYVHVPYSFGEDPPKDVAPQGADIWTEKGT